MTVIEWARLNYGREGVVLALRGYSPSQISDICERIAQKPVPVLKEAHD